jgi:hypothetical protein
VAEPVELLLMLALKLPEEYEAGEWLTSELDRRGRRKSSDQAFYTAALIDFGCYRKYGKVKSQHALARDLRLEGFRTAQRQIGEWRRKAYGCKPGEHSYIPPDAPTMSREEARVVRPFSEGRIEILKPFKSLNGFRL